MESKKKKNSAQVDYKLQVKSSHSYRVKKMQSIEPRPEKAAAW